MNNNVCFALYYYKLLGGVTRPPDRNKIREFLERHMSEIKDEERDALQALMNLFDVEAAPWMKVPSNQGFFQAPEQEPPDASRMVVRKVGGVIPKPFYEPFGWNELWHHILHLPPVQKIHPPCLTKEIIERTNAQIFLKDANMFLEKERKRYWESRFFHKFILEWGNTTAKEYDDFFKNYPLAISQAESICGFQNKVKVHNGEPKVDKLFFDGMIKVLEGKTRYQDFLKLFSQRHERQSNSITSKESTVAVVARHLLLCQPIQDDLFEITYQLTPFWYSDHAQGIIRERDLQFIQFSSQLFQKSLKASTNNPILFPPLTTFFHENVFMVPPLPTKSENVNIFNPSVQQHVIEHRVIRPISLLKRVYSSIQQTQESDDDRVLFYPIIFVRDSVKNMLTLIGLPGGQRCGLIGKVVDEFYKYQGIDYQKVFLVENSSSAITFWAHKSSIFPVSILEKGGWENLPSNLEQSSPVTTLNYRQLFHVLDAFKNIIYSDDYVFLKELCANLGKVKGRNDIEQKYFEYCFSVPLTFGPLENISTNSSYGPDVNQSFVNGVVSLYQDRFGVSETRTHNPNLFEVFAVLKCLVHHNTLLDNPFSQRIIEAARKYSFKNPKQFPFVSNNFWSLQETLPTTPTVCKDASSFTPHLSISDFCGPLEVDLFDQDQYTPFSVKVNKGKKNKIVNLTHNTVWIKIDQKEKKEGQEEEKKEHQPIFLTVTNLSQSLDYLFCLIQNLENTENQKEVVEEFVQSYPETIYLERVTKKHKDSLKIIWKNEECLELFENSPLYVLYDFFDEDDLKRECEQDLLSLAEGMIFYLENKELSRCENIMKKYVKFVKPERWILKKLF